MTIRSLGIIGVGLLIGLIQPAFGQSGYATGQGSALLGGSGGFSTLWIDQDTTEVKSSRLFLEAVTMVFIRKGMAVGADFTWDAQWQSGAFSYAAGIGPSMAYYFGSPDATIYPFVRGTIGFGLSDAEERDSFTRVAATGGVLMMMNDHIGLTAELTVESRRRRRVVDGIPTNLRDRFRGVRIGLVSFIF